MKVSEPGDLLKQIGIGDIPDITTNISSLVIGTDNAIFSGTIKLYKVVAIAYP